MGLERMTGPGQRPWRGRLSDRERWLGLGFFLALVLVYPAVIYAVERAMTGQGEPPLTHAQVNAVGYTVFLLILLAVFWGFLRHSWDILRENFRPSAFAFGAGFFAALALVCLAGCIPVPEGNPAILDYKIQFSMAPGATLAVVALLRPAVEEILYRGFLFGTLRRQSRLAAYAVSAGVFALAAVWQYVFPIGGPAMPVYLRMLLQYLPLGLALSWAYDISGSVLTPILLRAVLQAVFLLLAVMAPGEVLPMGI